MEYWIFGVIWILSGILTVYLILKTQDTLTLTDCVGIIIVTIMGTVGLIIFAVIAGDSIIIWRRKK